MDLASGPANNTGLQLSLDLGASSPTDELAVATAQKPIIKTMLFPRHVQLPHFGQIERQLKSAFAPFGIDIEFRFTRQNRLEMKWIFAAELAQGVEDQPQAFTALSQLAQLTSPAGILTKDELEAFDNLMIDFADA